MTISEVGRRCSVTADTLRYYERIGLIPLIGRNSSGQRDYTEQDCAWVTFARCMRSAGLSIETLIEYLRLYQQGNDTVEERRAILASERRALAARIDELQATLERLDGKIDRYDKGMMTHEYWLTHAGKEQG